MTNVGIDFMAFNNRLSLTADYYVKNTKDILLTVPIPISSGVVPMTLYAMRARYVTMALNSI